MYDESKDTRQLVNREAQEIVSKNIQEATFFNARPFELPVLSIEVNKKQSGRHHIIAGAYRVRENADKRIRQLEQKGYQAQYLGLNQYGLHQVSFGSYDDPREALEQLRIIRLNESADAWLLSRK